MELFNALNWWTVIAAVIVYFILGGLWYSVLFTKKWMELREVTAEDIGEPNPLIFLWSFLFQFVAVVVLGLFVEAAGASTAFQVGLVGFGIGLGILFTLNANTVLFNDIKPGLHLIDNGYHVLALTLAGLIMGAW